MRISNHSCNFHSFFFFLSKKIRVLLIKKGLLIKVSLRDSQDIRLANKFFSLRETKTLLIYRSFCSISFCLLYHVQKKKILWRKKEKISCKNDLISSSAVKFGKLILTAVTCQSLHNLFKDSKNTTKIFCSSILYFEIRHLLSFLKQVWTIRY